jgi:hypothetical protein
VRVVLLAFLVASSIAVSAQTPAATAAVSGVVVDGTTNAPVEGVIVSLLNDGNPRRGEFQRRVLTDARGRFVFAGLAPSERLTVSASKPGYLDGGFGIGPGNAGGRVVLREGEWARDVRIVIWKPGVISGAVLDERGEPFVNVFVQAYRRVRLLGHAQYVTGPLAATDDRGRYRFSDLVPGEYIVLVPSTQAEMRRGASDRLALVTAQDGTRLMPSQYPLAPPPARDTRLSYPPMFYPNTRSLDQAATIAVEFAAERSGIDVHLAPVPGFRIAGILDGPADARANIAVRLFPVGSDVLGPGGLAATAQTTADGRFIFVNIPAGPYTMDNLPAMTHLIHKDPALPNVMYGIGGGSKSIDVDIGPAGLMLQSSYGGGQQQTTHWIRQPLTIDRDDDRLVVPMRAPGIMTARIVKEIVPGTPVLELEPSVSTMLNPADGSPLLGFRESDQRMNSASDRLTIAGVLPGKYVLTTAASPTIGWIAKSIMWQGRDYTDQPLDFAETPDIRDVQIVVTNSAAEISGVVRNSDGAPVANGTVLVFPSSPALWNNLGFFPQRVRTAVTAASGRYVVNRIPAGRYSVVAMEGTVRPDIEVFQASQAAATPVTLSWTDKQSLDLIARRPAR